MGLSDVGLKVAEAIIPPHDAEGGKVWRWRVAIALLVGGQAMLNGFHVAWACGWLAAFGLQGFAQAETVQSVRTVFSARQASIEQQLAGIQIIQVRGALKDAIRERCEAKAKGNQAALDAANGDIEAFEDQYFVLARRPFMEPSCDVVLITPSR